MARKYEMARKYKTARSLIRTNPHIIFDLILEQIVCAQFLVAKIGSKIAVHDQFWADTSHFGQINPLVRSLHCVGRGPGRFFQISFECE